MRAFLLASCFSFGLLAPALAQEEEDFVELIEVVITGEQDEVLKTDAIRVIKTLSTDQIKYSSAITLSDVLRSQLNVRVNTDPVLGSGMSINGLGGNNIKIMIDGVPLVGRLNGEIDLSQIQIDQYERIEIIEGPLAVEYGTNSLAGTINLITASKADAPLEFKGKVRYESVGSYAQSASISGGKGIFSGKAQLSQNYFDGWSIDDSNWDWINTYAADSGRVSTWNPKVQRQASASGQFVFDNWIISPRVEYLSELIENKGYPRAPYGESAFDDEYQTNRLIHSVKLKSFDDESTKWEILASYQDFKRLKSSFKTDLTNLQNEVLGPEMQDTTRVINYMTRGTRNIKIHERISVRLGWDVSHETFSGERITEREKSLTDAALFSIFGYTSGNHTHQFGIRKAYNSSFKTPFLPSYNYLLKKDDYRWRFSYAKGFRSPSLKELHFQFVDLNHQLFGNPDLIAETSNYVQGSVSFSRNFESSIRVFYNDIKNQIGLVDQLDGTYQYVNFYDFTSNGAELNWSKKHSIADIELGLSVVGRKNSIVPDNVNNPFTYTTEISSSVSKDISKQLSVGAIYKFNGARTRFVNDGDNNIVSLSSAPYSILDASFSWMSENKNYAVQFGARNILDVTAIDSGAISGVHSGSMSWIAWGRSFVLSCSINL
jgi:outer membrane receptor for ferrienterochelin and colicins